MRYFPKRARKKQDISLLLKVCQTCLGDLTVRLGVTGMYYQCIQCSEIVQPASKRRTIPLPGLATLPGDFFPEAEPTLT